MLSREHFDESWQRQHERTALRCGDFRVHRTMERQNSTGKPWYKSGYTVTHGPSGAAVVKGYRRDAAARLAARLAVAVARRGDPTDQSRRGYPSFGLYCVLRLAVTGEGYPLPSLYEYGRRKFSEWHARRGEASP
jgi:hypothetical protein